MLSTIIETESELNSLLPLSRLEHRPPTELIVAAAAWSQAVWDKAEQLGPMPLSDEQVDKGFKLVQYPVFICGIHRSGTTLVRDLLDGHTDLLVLPSEGTYYTNLESKLLVLPENQQPAFFGNEWLRRLANPINQPPYWLLGRSSGIVSPYVDFARYLLAWWTAVNHKKGSQWPHTVLILAYASCTGHLTAKCWVDKTPTNERYLDRIWQEMPNAKIIHVIRDPAATLASRKRMEPSINIRSALLDMKTSFHIALEQSVSNDPKYMLLRYEELCETPTVVTERLASFLNIEVSTVLSQPTVAGMPSQANSSFNKQAAPGKILKSDQHQQQEVLSIAEHQLLSSYIGKLAMKLNYRTLQVSFLRGFYLRLKHRLF